MNDAPGLNHVQALLDRFGGTLPHFIAGRPQASGEEFGPIVSPVDGRELGRLSEAGDAAVDEAVTAAIAAQSQWWAKAPSERREGMRSFADTLLAHRDELGWLDTWDAGRPVRDTVTRDVDRIVDTLRYFSGLPEAMRGAVVPTDRSRINLTLREPLGVVAAIVPWNYPMVNAITKLAPALATGNGVVLKPAEQAPLSAFRIAELAVQAGLPEGLVNVINGGGPGAGWRLVNHPGVSKIAFTGSTPVGRRIAAAAGERLVPVTLELGGKTPNIVFDDADLDRALDASLFTVFMNQGQTCTAGTRLLVQGSVAAEFEDRLVERAAALVVGDPTQPETVIGPLVSEAQLDRARRYVERGSDEGARLATGGTRLDRPGFYLNPTVFVGVEPTMAIAREEIFGPVLSVLRFDDEDEAVAIANASAFGLAAAAWTRDVQRSFRLVHNLQSGLVWVNTVHALAPNSPYGGYKDSGIGKEMGVEAIEEFTRVKSAWFGVAPWETPWT